MLTFLNKKYLLRNLEFKKNALKLCLKNIDSTKQEMQTFWQSWQNMGLKKFPLEWYFYTPEVKLRTYYGMAFVRPSVRPLATSCLLNILKSLWVTVIQVDRKIGHGQ